MNCDLPIEDAVDLLASPRDELRTYDGHAIHDTSCQ